MNEPRELRERARHWFTWAKEDLAIAQATASLVDAVSRHACMWAHQAAEKAMKALLVDRDVDPPKTHELGLLNEMLDSAVAIGRSELDELSRWSIEGRYPADLDEATPRDVELALDTAHRVVATAERMLDEEIPGLT